MDKSVLISIRPEWCAKIAQGEKILEIRKTHPRLEVPFKCYVYCTLSGIERIQKDCVGKSLERGTVVGEFVCEKVIKLGSDKKTLPVLADAACMPVGALLAYLGDSVGYGWVITQLKIYQNPKALSSFYAYGTLGADEFVEQLYDGSGVPSRSSYAEYLNTRAIRTAPQSWCYVDSQPSQPRTIFIADETMPEVANE